MIPTTMEGNFTIKDDDHLITWTIKDETLTITIDNDETRTYSIRRTSIETSRHVIDPLYEEFHFTHPLNFSLTFETGPVKVNNETLIGTL